MLLGQALQKGWKRLLRGSEADLRETVIQLFTRRYTEKTEYVAQLSQHARKMRYPQFRENLFRIAAEEKEHVQWLKEKLLHLDAPIPQVSMIPKAGRNSWESLLMDLEVEKRCCADLMEQMYLVEQFDPDLAAELRHLREHEKKHLEEIKDMLMKSDPQAYWSA